MTSLTRSENRLASLERLLRPATLAASESMSDWTGGRISLDFEEAIETTIEEATSRLEVADEPVNMVALGLDGAGGGSLLLTFGDVDGARLASMLLGRPPGGENWAALERSALTETGNILVCAYVRSLSESVRGELFPTFPVFLRDYAAAAVEQALMDQAGERECVLVCRIRFRGPDGELDWNVLFLPDERLLDELCRASESDCTER